MKMNDVINVAHALGLTFTDNHHAALEQFVKEIESRTLLDFASYCRKGDSIEKIRWNDVAIEAEIMAQQTGAFIMVEKDE